MTLMALPDLADTIGAATARVSETGLELWHTVLQFEPDDGEPVHLAVRAGRIAVRAGGHPSPTTVLQAGREALVAVFHSGRDITHFIADGSVRLRSGDYYDVIFLSRALGRMRRDADPDGATR